MDFRTRYVHYADDPADIGYLDRDTGEVWWWDGHVDEVFPHEVDSVYLTELAANRQPRRRVQYAQARQNEQTSVRVLGMVRSAFSPGSRLRRRRAGRSEGRRFLGRAVASGTKNLAISSI